MNQLEVRRSLRSRSKLPSFVVEGHDEVLQYIHQAVAARRLNEHNNVLLHCDAHPDLCCPQSLRADDVYDKQTVYDHISIESWILPALQAGLFCLVIWIKPPWANQISDGEHVFFIGTQQSTGKIRVSLPEPYFVSEGLYCPPNELETKRTVVLHILTLPMALNSSLVETSVVENGDETYADWEGGAKLLKDSVATNFLSNGGSDVEQPSSEIPRADMPLRDLASQLRSVLSKYADRPMVLDICIDCFCTQDPFREVFSVQQRELIARLYSLTTLQESATEKISTKQKNALFNATTNVSTELFESIDTKTDLQTCTKGQSYEKPKIVCCTPSNEDVSSAGNLSGEVQARVNARCSIDSMFKADLDATDGEKCTVYMTQHKDFSSLTKTESENAARSQEADRLLSTLEVVMQRLAAGEHVTQLELGSRLPLLQAVIEGFRKEQGAEANIDWELVHNCGCTVTDDTPLPHYLTTPEEIAKLLLQLKVALRGVQRPALITVARSSLDEYCPSSRVNEIQDSIFSMLSLLYNNLEIFKDY